MSALVTFEIFGVFLNTSTPNDKYSRRYIQIFWQQFKTFYLKKKRLFVNFWFHFWNVHEI